MYTFDSRVRFSEVDRTGRLDLPGIINYFQDCSTFHSEDVGLGIDALKEKRRVWILSSWQVIVNRYPKMGERIDISTWATGFKGLYGTRNFRMRDEGKGTLAYANSIWVFMDMDRSRPVRPEAEEVEKYGVEPALEMQFAPRKIALSDQMEEKDGFPVRIDQIDTNMHVNNCEYVKMALEALDEDERVRQLRVEYRKSAVCGDMIFPRIAREKERTVVELCDGDGNPYAIVELTGERE